VADDDLITNLRVWNAGDPEPTDHPPVVDEAGLTWLWLEDGEGGHVWNRQQITRYEDGLIAAGALEWEWTGLLADYGPLREARDNEATNVVVVLGGAS
jgi:hypothetical protein